MTDSYLRTVGMMGTVVTIQVVGHGASEEQRRERAAAAARAIRWFELVEQSCSRFEPDSEISTLISRAGEAVSVSPIVYEAVRFALAVAADSDGAFDPTIGLSLARRGFDESYRTGVRVDPQIDAGEGNPPSYRDVTLDDDQKTIILARPLLLDLGAVAKGLAIDLAARELEPFEHFAIDAGGDLYLAGHNSVGEPWSVGIRHPRDPAQLIETLHVSNVAVCTSGDYERTGAGENAEHHILDPRTGTSSMNAASVTVIAPSAMVADALGTAAFVLGPSRGIELLERHAVEGVMLTPALERYATRGMRSDFVRDHTLSSIA